MTELNVDSNPRHFVTLGMFIIDEFEFFDEVGQPTGKESASQVRGPHLVLKASLWNQQLDWGRWYICEYWSEDVVMLILLLKCITLNGH